MKTRSALLSATLLFLGTASALFGTTQVIAADAALARRPLNSEDFYNMQIVTDPQVSPDGKWVAYVVTTNDRDADESRSAIWMASWDGTQQLPLTNPAHDNSAPRWSRDGRYLAYMATPAGTDKSQIMLLDRRGGEAQALTSVRDDIESYEWSPDSKRIVLVMEQSTAEHPRATKATPESPEVNAEPTKPLKQGGRPTQDGPEPPKESPVPAKGAPVDSPKPIVIDSIHFKQDKDGYLGSGRGRHLYLLEVESRKTESLIADPAYNEDLPAWSPDSQRIAFVRTHEKGADPDGMQDIELIEAQPSASATKLLRTFAPNQQKVAWSTDGKTLAFVQGPEAKYGQYTQDRLAIVTIGSGAAPREITGSLDRAITSYAFDKDSTVSVTVEDDGTAYAASVNIRTGAIKKLAQGPFVVTDLTTAVGHTALLYSDDQAPTEVYALEAGRLRKLTRQNDSFMAGLQLGGVEDLRCKSADGTAVHTLMVKPPNFETGRKYPAVLWIHGGPDLQDEHSLEFNGYQFKRQLLAASGFVVLGVNYRGSTGRGDAFSRSIFADWGHKEVEDLLAGVNCAVQSGAIDPDRLGIGGWSYGGILTDYTIASDPRFAAAVSGAGNANPLATYGADEYNIQYALELGDPWKNSALYIKLAYPLLHADRIHTPTLFMGGDKDFNVPIVGGEQMYLALRTLGVPAQLVVYPGQYHTLTRPSFLKDRAERIAAWYAEHLQSQSSQVAAHRP